MSEVTRLFTVIFSITSQIKFDSGKMYYKNENLSALKKLTQMH